MASAPARPRVLHLQFSDPAGYPPVQHVTRQLVDAGFDVSLLSLRAPGEAGTLDFPSIEHAQVHYVGDLARPTAALFAGFAARALAEAILTRPKWIYVSDWTAAPAGLLVHRTLGVPVVYHEHDTPGRPRTLFNRICFDARNALGRRADVNVLPNAGRAEHFTREARPRNAPVIVWNCAERREVAPARTAPVDDKLRAFYIGSITRQRPDASWVRAIADTPSAVELHLIGYETQSSVGHGERMMGLARSLGVGDRVFFHGPLARDRMLAQMAGYDVGVCLVPRNGDDLNLLNLPGASNKVFDTLASGAPVLVNDDPQSVAMFVDAGFGRACDPQDAGQIAENLRWFHDNRDACRAMGARGRARALGDWSYDHQFRPVLEAMRARMS